jgi:hypothetical protein
VVWVAFCVILCFFCYHEATCIAGLAAVSFASMLFGQGYINVARPSLLQFRASVWRSSGGREAAV